MCRRHTCGGPLGHACSGDLAAGHLAAYPDAEFTPAAIGRVLGRASGAVASALDRLTALGQAQLTSDHPRRVQGRRAPQSYLAA